MALTPGASVDAAIETPQATCVLTYDSLDVDAIIASIQDDTAGATAIFIGTTRNSFKGKNVTKLEYQAYSKVAIKTMSTIVNSAIGSVARSQHQPASVNVPSIIRCAVHHRLGTVPVGEPSIGEFSSPVLTPGRRSAVIAVSSPHRKEAFVACEEILEEVKKKAQIWKREYYVGEDENEAEWKANT